MEGEAEMGVETERGGKKGQLGCSLLRVWSGLEVSVSLSIRKVVYFVFSNSWTLL